MVNLLSLIVIFAVNERLCAADGASSLHGTWSSKSNQVFTGPGFYDPVDELLIEPSLPGISYSFTEDGFFEEAAYQVSSNPVNPKCPQAALNFQHGRYEVSDSGQLTLHPIEVDGRQLYSDPCSDNGTSTYVRYNQTETFQRFLVELDPYHGIYRLQLYQSDGSPMQPLYLAYRPPLMLPTVTLNPTASNSEEVASSTSVQNDSLRQLVRRGLENRHKTNAIRKSPDSILNSNVFWYLSAGMIGVGSLIFLSS
ncbi:hypothetical protein HG535_0A06930 [Zygotorulaspora mrakii]|uniref:Protein ROT1 n=1 Tax=Zygotorulaspora mrakii TaxID=42260 RepID=A0A7H9AWV2_ZYGMR|nr:uncharacterized protein HG535_0A06930 [Zygotorulaspora mrakii]QLG70751.1 hypothetical protein HG535_0A06930 [Zygotorulaspora mrakii]